MQIAYIREAECIGCVKCIQACPFDAIIGAEKQLHVIIMNECIGCGLCVAPCPVDCIEMREVTEQHYRLEKVKQRVLARKKRLAKQELVENKTIKDATEIVAWQAYIQAAVARIKAKKSI